MHLSIVFPQNSKIDDPVEDREDAFKVVELFQNQLRSAGYRSVIMLSDDDDKKWDPIRQPEEFYVHYAMILETQRRRRLESWLSTQTYDLSEQKHFAELQPIYQVRTFDELLKTIRKQQLEQMIAIGVEPPPPL
jgi:hypothetical protein